MRGKVLAVLLALLGFIAPALADPALVGRWSGTGEPESGQPNSVTMELRADGSLAMEQSGQAANGTWSAAAGQLTLTLDLGEGASASLTCAYQVAGDTLTLSGEERDCAEAPVFTRGS